MWALKNIFYLCFLHCLLTPFEMHSHNVAQTVLELSIKPGGESREGGKKEGRG